MTKRQGVAHMGRHVLPQQALAICFFQPPLPRLSTVLALLPAEPLKPNSMGIGGTDKITLHSHRDVAEFRGRFRILFNLVLFFRFS